MDADKLIDQTLKLNLKLNLTLATKRMSELRRTERDFEELSKRVATLRSLLSLWPERISTILVRNTLK